MLLSCLLGSTFNLCRVDTAIISPAHKELKGITARKLDCFNTPKIFFCAMQCYSFLLKPWKKCKYKYLMSQQFIRGQINISRQANLADKCFSIGTPLVCMYEITTILIFFDGISPRFQLWFYLDSVNGCGSSVLVSAQMLPDLFLVLHMIKIEHKFMYSPFEISTSTVVI